MISLFIVYVYSTGMHDGTYCDVIACDNSQPPCGTCGVMISLFIVYVYITGMPDGTYCDVITCDNRRPPCGTCEAVISLFIVMFTVPVCLTGLL